MPKQACPLRPGRAADSLRTPQSPLDLRNIRKYQLRWLFKTKALLPADLH